MHRTSNWEGERHAYPLTLGSRLLQPSRYVELLPTVSSDHQTATRQKANVNVLQSRKPAMGMMSDMVRCHEGARTKPARSQVTRSMPLSVQETRSSLLKAEATWHARSTGQFDFREAREARVDAERWARTVSSCLSHKLCSWFSTSASPARVESVKRCAALL